MQIYISKNGQQLGPFEMNAVYGMLQNGQLQANDLGIRQGDTQWQPLGNMFSNFGVKTDAPPVAPNIPPPLAAVAPKKGSMKGVLLFLFAGGVFFVFGIVGVAGYLMLNKKRSAAVYPPLNPTENNPVDSKSTTPEPADYTAMKTKAEELAGLTPPVKTDSSAKLTGKIAIVEKNRYDAELKGFDVYYKEIRETDLKSYNLTANMLATKPEEIDSLVQIKCTKGKKIGRYEGNIIGYANNCNVSLINYRTKTVFAQKMLTNSKPEESISNVYERSGEYVVIPPIVAIQDYIKSFVQKVEPPVTDAAMLPKIDDPKTFAMTPEKFAALNFPLKLAENSPIRCKVATIQSDEFKVLSATMIGLSSSGELNPPLPNSIILTKESLGFRDEQIARNSSEIDTLIQVRCKPGTLLTKIKGISVFSNVCTVSVVDFKGLATVAQKSFESKNVDAKRYETPSLYDDKQDIVSFPRTEIEEYIKSLPKA